MAKLARRQRRKLRFDCNDAIFADIDSLTLSGWETTGDWTLGQIVMHLALAGEEVYAGIDFTPPWFLRTIVAPLIKRRFLHVAMLSGYKIPNPNSKVLPPLDASVDEAVARLRSGCERIEREAPIPPHPFLGKLTHDEWKLLVLRHAELHLSYAHPKTSAQSKS